MTGHRLVGVALLALAPGLAADAGETRASAVEDAIELQMRWAGIPGLALAVVEDGTLVYRRAFGLANVELRAPLTTASVFQLSSTAKAFTGVAAMLLVQDDLLVLDEPVRRYLDELPTSWGGVTVRQLLTHTSGLPEVLECEAESGEDALACVADLPIPDTPGERFRYNQTNYFLVLRLIERLSGQPFPDFMRTRIFEPLGMLSTSYAGSVFDVVPGRVTSYYPDGAGGLRVREYHFPEFLYSAAGLNSSLDDLVAFARALGSGRLLEEDGRSELWSEPTLASGEVSTYGLGWDLKTHGARHRSAGHEGGGLTTIRHFIDDRLTVVVLTNGATARFDPDRVAARAAAIFAPRLGGAVGGLVDAMRSRLLDGDVQGVLAAHARFVGDPLHRDDDTEDAINRLGYDLLARHRPDQAVAVLRLNVDRYPESSNAYDSLGEALAAAGDSQAALARYRESVRLDPTNENAREMIGKLEGAAAGSGP